MADHGEKAPGAQTCIQDGNLAKQHMQNAKAFVFAAEEDFGITPVEAQACGTPVIAFGKGGALETVVDANQNEFGTGIFFQSQDGPSIIAAVNQFEAIAKKISAHNCRIQAERFAAHRFRSSVTKAVEDAVQELSY